MVAGQPPRMQAYAATHVEVPATATGPVTGNGVRSARQITPPSRVKNRPGRYAQPCCADTNAMPACASGWYWPMAGRLAAQCRPPSVVRSIHDRSVVLWSAYPKIAVMPVSRLGNAMARAWYLPFSTPGIRHRPPTAADPPAWLGEPAGADGALLACEGPLVITSPARAPVLAHPAIATTAVVKSTIGSLFICHLPRANDPLLPGTFAGAPGLLWHTESSGALVRARERWLA